MEEKFPVFCFGELQAPHLEHHRTNDGSMRAPATRFFGGAEDFSDFSSPSQHTTYNHAPPSGDELVHTSAAQRAYLRRADRATAGSALTSRTTKPQSCKGQVQSEKCKVQSAKRQRRGGVAALFTFHFTFCTFHFPLLPHGTPSPPQAPLADDT